MFERGKMARKDRPRSFIHWVSNPLPCTVRMFKKLYVCRVPSVTVYSIHTTAIFLLYDIIFMFFSLPPIFRFTAESPEEAEDGILSVVNPVRCTDHVY